MTAGSVSESPTMGGRNASRTAARVLIATAFVDSLGTGLFASALFFTLYIGVPAREVGLGLMAAGLCGLPCTVPLAKIADRYDPVRVLAVVQALRGVLFLSYLLVTSVTEFILITCLLGCLARPVQPVTQSIVVRVSAGARRIDALAKMRVVRNIGLGIGGLASTAALVGDRRAALAALVVGNAASFFFAAGMLVRLRGLLSRAGLLAPPGIAPVARKRISAVRDATYMSAAFCNGALCLYQSAVEVGIPLWIVTSRAAPTYVPAALMTANTVIVILFQVRVARSASATSGARRHITMAAACLATFALLTAMTGSVSTVVALTCFAAGIIVQTFGEMWQSSSSWFVSNEFAVPEQRSEYLAAYSLGNTTQTILGPAVFSALIVPAGGYGWLGLAVLFGAVGLVYPRIVSRLAARAASTPEAVCP